MIMETEGTYNNVIESLAPQCMPRKQMDEGRMVYVADIKRHNNKRNIKMKTTGGGRQEFNVVVGARICIRYNK